MKTKITIAQFNQLLKVDTIVEHDNKEKKKEIKYKLLDSLQDALADKWYNLKQETKEALQYACMRSTEQGFFFCSPTHLSDKFNIGVATVYNVFRELIQAKVVYKVNRTSTKHNGKGNAVYVFTNHPNFPTICEILNINYNADYNHNYKTDNDERLTLPMDSSDNSASTLLLPTTLQNNIKENDKDYNVLEDETDRLLKEKIAEYERNEAEKSYEKPAVKWHKYVPKEINEKFGYYGDLLTDLWRKIKLAERKVNVVGLKDTDKLEVAMRVLNNLKKHRRFKQMSVDEMCAYVYKGHLNGLFNLVGNENLESMFIDEKYDYYAYLDPYGNHIPTTSEDVLVMPEWYEDNTEEYYVGEFAEGEAPTLDNFPF